MSDSNALMPADGKTVDINGFEMYFRVVGQGPPLILLHGFLNESHTMWDPFLLELAKFFRVVVPDLRGHGRSSNPSGTFTHRQSAFDVYALLDYLEIKQFCGIGFSTGGMTLIHMATQQPSRVEAMVLASATIYFPKQARAIMHETSMEELPPERLAELRRRHKDDGKIRALIKQFHCFEDSYDDMNFTPPFLSTITAKTLIVHGDRDEFFPVAVPIGMYESIPDSFLWIVPNGDHGLFMNEQATAITAETFQRVALDFLHRGWDVDQ